MKKISLVLLLLVLHLFCAPQKYWKIRVELPGISVLSLNQYKKLVLADFLVEKETEDFKLNKELLDYFSVELGSQFKGKIVSKQVSLEEKDSFKNQALWKDILPDTADTLFLTGSARYSQEIRKAILEKTSDRYQDPLSSAKGLAQRKFFTLALTLYLIDAETGEILYERNFKESKGYPNPKQTSNFAFFDLVQLIKVKFFRNIFGDEMLQQRYLISD